MSTTYDEIWLSFINNTGVDTSRIPAFPDDIYETIQNGINHYNAYLKDEPLIVGNNQDESINITLDGTRLLILAYCIKYIYLENQLVGFEELWSPFQQEVGIKDYRGQVAGRENTLERTNKKIIELITSIEDPSIM